MAEYAPSVLQTRRQEMYFLLTPEEIEHLRRFGDTRQFVADDTLVRAGEVGAGMIVLLSGEARVERPNSLGEDVVNSFPAGSFISEVDQLSGRPSLVTIRANSEVEALFVPPAALRNLVIAEAELGARIMRSLILRRVGLIETGAAGPVLLGTAGSPQLVRLQNFLTRNGAPHRVLDRTDPAVAECLGRLELASSDLPVVLCPDGSVLHNPTLPELARHVGLLSPSDPAREYDVAVVGAGPAGLATAVYAASEGLSVAVLETHAFGGQAGSSSRIENYLGFPTGISGQALTARAFIQAQKFGVDVRITRSVTGLRCNRGDCHALTLDDGTILKARVVVIASGAEYRHPAFNGMGAADQGGVHYWVSPIEGGLCAGQEVALVGGGNSAGQAAVYLAGRAAKVWMVVRAPGLEASMSRYLIDRIKAQPNIELVTSTEIERLDFSASGALDRITWRSRLTGNADERQIRHLFLFIGADPCTAWLSECNLALDAKGFIATGRAARPSDSSAFDLMTSHDGVFAVGDVRSGSTKRVAAAVGEGAAVVAQIHSYLATVSSNSETQGAVV